MKWDEWTAFSFVCFLYEKENTNKKTVHIKLSEPIFLKPKQKKFLLFHSSEGSQIFITDERKRKQIEKIEDKNLIICTGRPRNESNREIFFKTLLRSENENEYVFPYAKIYYQIVCLDLFHDHEFFVKISSSSLVPSDLDIQAILCGFFAVVEFRNFSKSLYHAYMTTMTVKKSDSEFRFNTSL